MEKENFARRFKKFMCKERWNSERYYQMFLYFIIILLSVICLYPLIYIVSASLMSVEEWQLRNGVFLFPHKPTLDAYIVVFSQQQLYLSLWVSVARTVCGSVLSTATCMLVGYALSRSDFFLKRPLSVILFITMIYGGGLIPGYLVIEQMGLLNTFWVFIIPGMLSAWNALVFRQAFQGVPPEIEESAMLDGATPLRCLWSILLPLNMPTVAVILLFCAVGQWNSWFDASMYIESSNAALTPLQLFLQHAFAEQKPDAGQATLLNIETQRMAIAVIGILPILCVYPFFQKYFTKGVYVGAVKG
mgnify:CR=1 FL=1